MSINVDTKYTYFPISDGYLLNLERRRFGKYSIDNIYDTRTKIG